MSIILGIETSCDDTSVALVAADGNHIRVIVQKTASQIKLHARYGGVVPEVAARKHAETIIPVVRAVFKEAGLQPDKPRLDAIAVTAGPGLITALFVGVETARALGAFWNKPVIGVNHIEGHLYSNWLDREKPIKFPALCLVVSGGHTELILMRNHTRYKLLGKTRDDAAGEAFDKIGKLLGFAYPGGPKIARAAPGGKRNAIAFPRPMLHSPDFNFSFAGLKTAARSWLASHKKFSRKDFCASFEEAIVATLVHKTMRAVHATGPKTVLIAGGVAANNRLRTALRRAVHEQAPNVVYEPVPVPFTTDNAAMIAAAGYFHLRRAEERTLGAHSWRKIKVDPEWELV